jgi:hypothetical protein
MTRTRDIYFHYRDIDFVIGGLRKILKDGGGVISYWFSIKVSVFDQNSISSNPFLEGLTRSNS